MHRDTPGARDARDARQPQRRCVRRPHSRRDTPPPVWAPAPVKRPPRRIRAPRESDNLALVE